MVIFYREKELCELFRSENREFDINFNINSSKVTIFVRHSGSWDSQEGKKNWISSGKTLSYQLLVGKIIVKS